MGILNGDLATLAFNSLKDRVLTGTIRRRVMEECPGLDQFGDQRQQATPTDWTVKGFVSDYEEKFRDQAGIPETDILVCILTKSHTNIPQKEDYVSFDGQWYEIRKVRTDPAKVTWNCQAFKITELTASCQ